VPKAATSTATFRSGGLSRRRPTAFAFVPDAGARAALAAELGLLDLPMLRFAGTLAPEGRQDVTLSGRLEARAVQACVVTLDPVPSAVSEDVVIRYLAEAPSSVAEEMEMPEDTGVEDLPEVIDVAAVAAEALILALPLYPRAPGAELGAVEAAPPGAAPLAEDRPNPFAALAALKEKDR
jgi:uncharacterized metal-binding protein YceD (DUF177 family)